MMNFLGNYAAEIIAICALFFTGYATYATRKHNRLSVKPHLTTFTHRNQKPGEGVLAISLSNNGLGPALIKNFEIYLDNQALNIKDSREAERPLREVLGERNFNHSITILGNQSSMPANDKKDLLIIHFENKDEEDFDAVEKELNRFDLVVNYESMYGEAFIFDSRDQTVDESFQPTTNAAN